MISACAFRLMCSLPAAPSERNGPHVGGDGGRRLTTRFRRRLSACRVASKLARVRVDIVPDKLAVRVEAHDIPSRHGPMACWSYVTDGLSSQGQTEIVF